MKCEALLYKSKWNTYENKQLIYLKTALRFLAFKINILKSYKKI